MTRRKQTQTFHAWVSALDIFCALVIGVLVLYVHGSESLLPDAEGRVCQVEANLDSLRSRLREARAKLQALEPEPAAPAPRRRPEVLEPEDPNRPELRQAAVLGMVKAHAQSL